eukprot:CAMPEP_0119310230 /NCGR_PEP_ID=MMETSP1333-20130426/18301_1 /TAXON_ID=418940 /ORGANISM="Scyphosphaera apsteinii, Strain RCC1455" /LENGTH=443 /DNA_ID=CAMNT_0007314381 /DNA_START=39 /DNA_END=1370 /DNA_ORIENTATION=-
MSLQPPPPPPQGPPPPPPRAGPAPPPPPSAPTDEDSQDRKRKRDTYYDNEEEITRLAAKDDLTLMLRQLHPKTGEFDVYEMFSKTGKVLDVRLIVDERSGKCQGVGYVEMSDQIGLAAALQLNGQELLGQQILVQSSLAEKNRLAAAGATTQEIKMLGGQLSKVPGEGLKLYVGGLHYDISEEQLRALFSPFGPLDKVDLHREAGGESKGFGFIHFKNAADGQKCIDQMDGFQLAGRAIRVTISAMDQGGPVGVGSSINPALLATVSPAMLATSGAFPKDDNQVIANLDSLDDSISGRSDIGKVSAAQRASIMAKLAHNAGLDVPEETLKAAQTAGLQTVEQTSRCLVLKNMFDRLSDEAQSNANFFTELAEEVRVECSKLGTVIHCAAHKWSNGFVYVKMLAHTEATRVKERMHGRFFAKNKILCELIDEGTYDKKNKLSSM